MANQWFKFYGGEYLSDPKIGRLTPAERSCWITILSMASMTEDGIIKFLEVEDLLYKSGIKWNPYNEGDYEECQSILIKLSGMKMIDVNPDKSEIILTNWKKRQETALSVAERVAKHRKNKLKQAECNENVTECVTNVTTEENRIEEKRKRESVEDSAPLPKTFKNFRDQARARIGNPPMEKMVLSEKQQSSIRSMKLLSRIHDAGIKYGYDYLNEEDEQANKKYQGQVKPFEKRYPTMQQQDEYIEWFFTAPEIAYANGHPSNFFSVSTWLVFDNRKNTKSNKSKGMAL